MSAAFSLLRDITRVPPQTIQFDDGRFTPPTPIKTITDTINVEGFTVVDSGELKREITVQVRNFRLEGTELVFTDRRFHTVRSDMTWC